MSHVLGLRCIRCAKEHAEPSATGALGYVCGGCGGNLEVVYDLAAIRRSVSPASLKANSDASVWRYAAFLPGDPGPLASRLAVGGTPLLEAPMLGREVGLGHLQLKDDTRLPSASFKDRASAVALVHAHARGERVVAGASTGNAASSTACLAARSGMRTLIFLPENAPRAKVAQILLYGAQVVAVRGTYDQAFDLCLAACAKHGWYNRNTGHNPWTREGKKTCAFEIAEQRGWRVPDWVFVPVGDGNILSGVWKGFVELHQAGFTDRVPRLAAVQAERSNAIQLAFEGDGELRPVSGETIADSISVGLPRDGHAAVRALHESNGIAVLVSDEDILAGMRLAARTEGVFAEPAAAASIAGAARAVRDGRVRSHESVVALVTGNGLKDVNSAMRAAGTPTLIDPDLGSFERLLSERIRL